MGRFLLISLSLATGLTVVYPGTPAWAQASSGLQAGSGDLSLKGAEKLWLEKNRELQQARIAVKAAEADRVTANEAPNPQLTLSSTSLNPRTGIGGGSLREKRADSVIRIDQQIERGGKRELRTKTAGALVQAAREDLQDSLRQGRMQLVSAYWDLRQAQERLNLAQDTAELYHRTIRATELRLKVGDVAAADLARLKVEAARADNDARGAVSDLAQAQSALAYQLGREIRAADLVATDPWPALSAGEASSTAQSQALDQRPDVRAAQARVEAAEHARDLARANRSRDISVGVQFEHFPEPDQSANNTYGVSVSVPLFLRHSYEGEIARAEADLEQAREALDQVRGQAQTDLAQAAAQLASARERRQRLEGGLLQDAERAAKAAEFAYTKGASSLVDLLDARRTLKAVQLDGVGLRADYAKALAAWEAAQGK